MTKNAMAEMLASVRDQSLTKGYLDACREMVTRIDNDRKERIDRQDETEYTRGVVDGLTIAYQHIIESITGGPRGR